MSSRVTRSSTKKSANSSSSASVDLSSSNPSDPPPPPLQPSVPTRKRKASSASIQHQTVQAPEPVSVPTSFAPKPKRVKSKSDPQHQQEIEPLNTQSKRSLRKRSSATMPTSPGDDHAASASGAGPSSSKRKSGKSKKTQSSPESSNTPSKSRSKSSSSSKKRPSTPKKEKEQQSEHVVLPRGGNKSINSKDDTSDEPPPPPQDDDSDPLDEGTLAAGSFRSRGGLASIPGFGGMASYIAGVVNQMRTLLNSLKQKDDPNQQYAALQELSEMLLISNEDNLSGHFNSDAYAKEFISIASLSEADAESNLAFQIDNELLQNMRLLASRCIANLIEALPSATAPVVYNGAVPVLVSHLLVIDNFDVAEQALTTLEKISAEFPSALVREGGLNALLENLDFFTSNIQRTAVTAAANCCRAIPEDSFPTIRDIMPKLRSVLNSSDQKVVEQGSLCITRIVDSFRYSDTYLEELMDADLLATLLRLLLPGATNLVSSSIHTQFLRVLSTTAKASPALTKELFKMDITDTLYQILTGVSAPASHQNAGASIDSVVVMQALIHRPRDQVFETLNVICELLPGIDTLHLGYLNELAEMQSYSAQAHSARSSRPPIDKRLQMLSECKKELRRFATVLFPTLADAYSSTVNLNVRQRVLTAQLKMLCNLDQDILEEALQPVPYASYLASILSQQDHPFLVIAGLQASELLLQRLNRVYRYQFYREGVMAEMRKLANRTMVSKVAQTDPKTDKKNVESKSASETRRQPSDVQEVGSSPDREPDNSDGSEQGQADEGQEDHEDDDGIDEDNMHDSQDEDGDSEDSDAHGPPPPPSSMTDTIQDMITRCAQNFMTQYETEEGAELRSKATQVLDDLNNLVENIADCYNNDQPEEGARLFTQLAKSFEGNALESITSYELLSSKVVHTLVEIFDTTHSRVNTDARSAFIEAFMTSTASSNIKTSGSTSPSTPFSVLVQKLQDLLSRAEHFEVVTVNSNAHDSNRGNPASALSKQIRIRLVAEGDDSGIPPHFRTIMVSIHAIATLKSLEEYLRPRIALGERSHASRPPGGRMGPSFAAHLAAGLDNPEAFLSRRLASTPAPPTSSYPLPPFGRSSSAREAPKPTMSPAEDDNAASSASMTTPQPRRSTRKTKNQPKQSGPDDRALNQGADSQRDLECADEAQMSDDDEIDSAAALLEDMEDLAGSPSEPEPSAVNVDVTPGGGLTTRDDSGSLSSTPQRLGSSTDSRPLSSNRPRSSADSLARRFLASVGSQGIPSPSRMSYSAAIQSTPTDWHLEFSVSGRSISTDTTIYRTVHNNPSSDGAVGRNVWTGTHSIQFRRVEGPPPSTRSISSRPTTPPEGPSGLPHSLEQNPITAIILRLLRILHEINGTIDELIGERRKTTQVSIEPLSQFVNTKLTAKMNRQLEEPLIVASRSLPSWSEDLARFYPFLFPFETRHLFLQSTSFGYGRSMNRWLSAQDSGDSRHRHRDERPLIGRLQRQKVRIQRQRFLDSAVKVMDSYGANTSILEVEYFDEVGTGLGPTLEFYSSASKEFSKKRLMLWRENESSSNSEYAFGKQGLFPAPMTEAQVKSANGEKALKLFNALGKFVARSMLDSRIIDVSFNTMFFRWRADAKAQAPTISAIKMVDEDLAKSLMTLKQFDLAKKKILEQKRLSMEQKRLKIMGIRVADASILDLGLDFTLPGYPEVELVANGRNVEVTIDNVGEYVDAVVDLTLGRGVKSQIESFRSGFSEIFPYTALRAFTPDELVMLFGRVDEDWSMETLMDSIKADHGYNLDSKSVRNLLQTMSEFTVQQRRDFLQFVTGSPKLPIGGFKALTPSFTVVLRPSEPQHHPDEYLPSCMTCVNYLKLPDYSELEAMKMKVGIAMREGQGAFHLS